jgi:hypothetical protein
LAADYLIWLKPHMDDMLALPGFVAARLHSVASPKVAGRVDWVASYDLQDAAAMQAYLDVHSAKLRGSMPEKFKGKVSFTRRTLFPVQ